MKNKIVIILAIIIIILAGYIAYSFVKNKPAGDFSLRLTSDGTSSGASRYYEMNINYQNNIIVFANKTEVIDDTLGNHLRCVEQFNVQTKAWDRTIKENYPDNRTCANFLKMYSSKQEIDQAINSGEIVNKNEGCHQRTCYEIIQEN